MPGELLADAFANQLLGSAVRRRHKIGVALVLNLQALMEIRHQQRPGFAAMADMVGRKLSELVVSDMVRDVRRQTSDLKTQMQLQPRHSGGRTSEA